MEPKDYLRIDLQKLFSDKTIQIYQHFKGHVYIIMGKSIDTESGTVNMLYRRLFLDEKGLNYDTILWSRPIDNFNKNVPYTLDPRFKLLTQEEVYKLLSDEYNNNLNSKQDENIQ